MGSFADAYVSALSKAYPQQILQQPLLECPQQCLLRILLCCLAWSL